MRHWVQGKGGKGKGKMQKVNNSQGERELQKREAMEDKRI